MKSETWIKEQVNGVFLQLTGENGQPPSSQDWAMPYHLLLTKKYIYIIIIDKYYL